MSEDRSTTQEVALRIATAMDRTLEESTSEAAKRLILDAVIAMISGATLPPGRAALRYVDAYAAPGQATVVGTSRITRSELAAFANGMSAHSDETDDINDHARMHPGASIVPAALAVAEADDRSGNDLIHGVVIGYDVGCGVSMAAWESMAARQQDVRSPHGLGQTLGAAAAAASIAGLSELEVQYVLSFACQQASGFTSFYRADDHMEKAFASAAMQAHSGVRATELVRHGFVGVRDVLDGSPNVFDAFGSGGDGHRLIVELDGSPFVERADVKRYSAGMPIQAAAEALQAILATVEVRPENLRSLVCRLPTLKAEVVNNRAIPDIHLQYLMALMIIEGDIRFEDAHDHARRARPDIQELIPRIQLRGDPELDGSIDGQVSTRRAIVEVQLADGREFTHRVNAARGSRFNPLTWEEMRAKAGRVLGRIRSESAIEGLVNTFEHLDRVESVQGLRPLLHA